MRQRPFAMIVLLAAVLPWVGSASSVHAHIKLTKPDSWLKESSIGGPQKGGPCGTGGADDVNPAPVSDAITTFEVGETITLEWTETVPHPGHFRVAFAEDRNDLKDPELEFDGSCNYDESKLPTGAHGNVLADGVFARSRMGALESSGKTFSTQVTLPDKPCEKCTLQVLQFMENHPPRCLYYHCADVRLVAKGSAGSSPAAGKAGSSGESKAAGSGAVGGAVAGSQAGAAAVSGSPAADEGGCSVRPVRGARWSSALVLGAALCLLRLRRRHGRSTSPSL